LLPWLGRRAIVGSVGAILLAILIFAVRTSIPDKDVSAVEDVCSPRSAQSTLSVLHLRSPDLSGDEREVWVYRPLTPDTETLPVLYVLHGFPGKPEDVFAKSVCDYLDARTAAGDPPFVIAAPDGNGAVHPDTE
jgi:poly(3-hydroxybutyrate) depolymerase